MAKKLSDFSKRLKELRAKAGLSQTQLARASGVAVGAIRHLEYGMRKPMFETVEKLAKGLGVDLNAFGH